MVADWFSLYPKQVKAVDAIVKAFDSGKDLVVVVGPTGSGKTLVGAELSRRLNVRTFTTTPLVTLVQQMDLDPKFRETAGDVEVLMGRRRWQCYREPKKTVEEAVCKELDSQGKVLIGENNEQIACRFKKWDERGLPDCAYYHRKAEVEMARVGVTTLAYFLYGVREVRGPYGKNEPKIGWDFGMLSGRDLLIVDEAHGLAETAVNQLSVSWSRIKYDRRAEYVENYDRWTRELDLYRLVENNHEFDGRDDVLVEILEALRALLNGYRYRLSDSTDQKDQKEVESIDQDLESLEGALNDLKGGIPWVGTFEPAPNGRFTIQPVIAGHHLQRLLWSKARKVVLMSATFTDIQGMLNDCGLRNRTGVVVRIPSSFPPQNSPIYLMPVAKLSKGTLTDHFPIVASAVWKILEKEPGRGLIHTSTFNNASWLGQLAPPEIRQRMKIHQPGDNREQLLRWFMEKSPAGCVLVSPSMMEGIDLKGDLGEFTIFVKASYPNLGDRRIARRLKMPDGRRWYEQQVIEDTIQGRGRTVRSETDLSRCYVLDSNLVYLIQKWWHRLPDWFRLSIQHGNARAQELMAEIQPPATWADIEKSLGVKDPFPQRSEDDPKV